VKWEEHILKAIKRSSFTLCSRALSPVDYRNELVIYLLEIAPYGETANAE
jgi:hypothetical protein